MLRPRSALPVPAALGLALVLALAGCGRDSGPPPVSKEALAAVAADPGVPREALARAVDALFTQPATDETRALLVLHGGRIVAERYGAGYGPGSRLIGWSMSKTITGVMIGQLVADGRLRLDEPAPVPEWQRPGDPRGEITLRQLLQMRSGLRHVEGGDPVYRSDEVRMLYLDGRDNMAAYAEAQPLAALPGKTWNYSTATTVILCDLAARMLAPDGNADARRAAVDDYLRTRVLDPLGMRSMVPEYDAAGTLIGSSLIHGTARDWAKFGEFLRSGGSVRGAQLVPRGWITFMTTPSPRNPGYGAQTWTNRPQIDTGKVEFPGAPASAFSMNGHLGQFVLISPRQGLTIVRLGKTDEGKLQPVRDAMGQIAALFPR
jgi:CubicO group peptidase (beta-lactamase class C family)